MLRHSPLSRSHCVRHCCRRSSLREASTLATRFELSRKGGAPDRAMLLELPDDTTAIAAMTPRLRALAGAKGATTATGSPATAAPRPWRIADPAQQRKLEDALTARDVMTRAVMCVSEGQPLIEAAHMMLHKDVDQIPVARDGRLVGVVTRAKVLRALHQRNVAALAERKPS